jgi:hypothetical protein
LADKVFVYKNKQVNRLNNIFISPVQRQKFNLQQQKTVSTLHNNAIIGIKYGTVRASSQNNHFWPFLPKMHMCEVFSQDALLSGREFYNVMHIRFMQIH